MRIQMKVLLVSFLISLIVLAGAGYLLNIGLNNSIVVSSSSTLHPRLEEAPITDSDRTDLSIMTRKSARVNILLLATNSDLADMMMVISYDPIRKLVDVVSIPRDTYNEVPGYTYPQWLKINATYKMKKNLGGADGVRTQLEKILNIPINYYVHVDFDAVRAIVDTIGGVEVDIQRRMFYDDVYAKPPLHIDFHKGHHILNGDDAVKFLRWRKNNDGYEEGDIQRIKRQHQFVKTVISKSIGIKLPEIVGNMAQYMKTDMALKDMVYYAGTALGLDPAYVQTYRIPGESTKLKGLSYFIHNPTDTEKMMLAIYNRMETTPPITQTITELKQLDPSAVEAKTSMPVQKDTQKSN